MSILKISRQQTKNLPGLYRKLLLIPTKAFLQYDPALSGYVNNSDLIVNYDFDPHYAELEATPGSLKLSGKNDNSNFSGLYSFEFNLFIPGDTPDLTENLKKLAALKYFVVLARDTMATLDEMRWKVYGTLENPCSFSYNFNTEPKGCSINIKGIQNEPIRWFNPEENPYTVLGY